MAETIKAFNFWPAHHQISTNHLLFVQVNLLQYHFRFVGSNYCRCNIQWLCCYLLQKKVKVETFSKWQIRQEWEKTEVAVVFCQTCVCVCLQTPLWPKLPVDRWDQGLSVRMCWWTNSDALHPPVATNPVPPAISLSLQSSSLPCDALR